MIAGTVYMLLDQHGDKTSVKRLINLVEEYCGHEVNYHYVVNCRRFWRQKNGINSDCRKYQTQHRRDMLSDEVSNETKSIAARITGNVKRTVKRLLNSCTSIDQLRNVFEMENAAA